MPAPPKVSMYGIKWDPLTDPLSREMYMIKKGGRFKSNKGNWFCGNGLFFHFKQGIKLLWPELIQHRWFDRMLKEWLDHKYIGVMGPKNSGKTTTMAVIHLFDWYCFSSQTTVLLCSTTREMLENRIWGEVKKWHRLARDRKAWLPGFLIEGRQRIVADNRDVASEGRDFRNGIMGIPMKKGNAYVGMSDVIGIKNKRKRLCGDELQALPKSFIDATANFMDQGECKVTGMGNPAQTTDALGILCEPAANIGGWDGSIDQTPKTKSWPTRFSKGVCVQLPGSDSPNHDVPASETVPFPFLMTREQMELDAKTWGKEDWHYTMFNEGRMPRGQGSRRIITRQICIKHHAMEEAVWANTNRTIITSLDAAYRGVGGDRCVYTEVEFGEEARSIEDLGERLMSAIISQTNPNEPKHQIISLIRQAIIPIEPSDFKSPEDQIVDFVRKEHEKRAIPPENHYFDAGMKTSLVSAYARMWSPRVNTIDFGGRPTERKVSANIDVSCRDYYSKFVTELWYSVRLVIEADQFRGLTEDLVMEGCQREWKTVGANKIEVETKDDMKAKTGRSPDLFDSLVCAIEGCRQRGFIIKKLDNPKAKSTDWAWKRELFRKQGQVWHSRELNVRA